MIKQTMKKRWFNLETRPSRLFGDRDRDGVANVFDCQPRNRRRQDGDDDREAFANRQVEQAMNTYTLKEDVPDKVKNAIRRELYKQGKYLKD